MTVPTHLKLIPIRIITNNEKKISILQGTKFSHIFHHFGDIPYVIVFHSSVNSKTQFYF